MDVRCLHLIQGNNIHISYNAQSMDLSVISPSVFHCLQMMQNGNGLSQVISEMDLDEDETLLLKQTIENLTSPNLKIEATPIDIQTKYINRITLHVSNDCNLRCKYCYAEGGAYKQERNLMSIEDADIFIDFCCKYFDDVKYIVFFGGEPMLNVPIMEHICKVFKHKYDNKKCPFLPKFGMITNGTILNDRITNLVREHISFITVSIDGPQEINDANRIFPDGRGSYSKIHKFIKRMKQETNVYVRFEATYTQEHINKKYTQGDIESFLSKEFGIDGDVVEELSVQEHVSSTFGKNFDYNVWKQNEHLSFPDGFWSILAAIKNKHSKTMCELGHKTFSVATNGDIYPCHMNNGETNNCIGNTRGNHIFSNPEYYTNFRIKDLKNNSECKTCWASKICGGCSHSWFYNQNTKLYEEIPNQELCRKNRNHIEKVLLLIALCRKDPIIWNKLLNKTNSINQ